MSQLSLPRTSPKPKKVGLNAELDWEFYFNERTYHIIVAWVLLLLTPTQDLLFTF